MEPKNNIKLKDFFNSDRSAMTRASIERNIATIITVYNKIRSEERRVGKECRL